MSYDQKPGKMRVVGSSSAAPQRRRGDGAAGVAGAAGSAGVAAGALASTSAGVPGGTAANGTATEQGSKPVLLMGLIFIAGCAIGGVALPLLGVI